MSKSKDFEVPVFAGKPLVLQQDGSGWRREFNGVDVRVSYCVDVDTWRAVVRIHRRRIASCDFASSPKEAAARVEINIRETAATMNAAVSP